MNHGYIYRDRVSSLFVQRPAIEFYVRSHRHSTAAQWLERFEAGRIRRAGAPISADTPLAEGDELEWHRPPWEEPPVPSTIPVVFEDADLLAVDKPAGLPVLPGGGYLEHTLLHILRARASDNPALSPLHRLDRGASGLILLGRTHLARSRLGKDFARHRIQRLYLAVLAGLLPVDELLVEHPIGQVPHPRLGSICASALNGKPARTRFRVLDRDASTATTLVEADLFTGRTHQIRIHAAVAGHPLAGDTAYARGGLPRDDAGGSANQQPHSSAAPRYRLHSWQAGLRHPRTGQMLRLTVPPPEDFWMCRVSSIRTSRPQP